MNRREFVKLTAIGAATAAAASMMPGIVFAGIKEVASDLEWKKTPCRFCGTGCGLLIGLLKGKAVAVRGDPSCSVNKGLACVKGYHSVQTLYAKDRLKHAYVRREGKLTRVPISEALDIVADKIKETVQKHGKDAISMYGSGQWTIPDGYVASKLFKGCLGTNNLEANARICMASAAAGFYTTFGIDEPMGCYADMEQADVFVLWGNNMAEMHPVLFSRLLERRRRSPHVKIIDLCTRRTRTSRLSDHTYIFAPHTDLAIANAICHEILQNNQADLDFVKKHTRFVKGKFDIGYGLEDDFEFKDKGEEISLAEYKTFLADYTPEKVAGMSGLSAADIRDLAAFFGAAGKKCVSYWCMGINQHSRGTWANNLIYNIHLLTGKISKPGNGPFSLTGQPSACGTVREVGTLTHKLPHGVVMNEQNRNKAAKIWGVPVSNIDPKPSNHTVSMFRALDRGDIRFMWVQVTNPMVTMPKLNRYRKGAEKEDRFIVVSEIYPTPTTEVADVILPAAMWIEREGMFGNSERRTQHWDKMVDPPGEAMSDTMQIIEVARRLGYEKHFPYRDDDKSTHIQKIYDEYTLHHLGDKHGMAPYDELRKKAGVQWPYVNGKETQWRFNEKYDPAVKKGTEFQFYGHKDGKAIIWARPYEPPAESPSKEFPMWLCTGRVLEHWHSGSMTRRVPILHRAMPEAYVEIHPDDAKAIGVSDGGQVKVTSPRGTIILKAMLEGRGRPVKGTVFVPFFDENKLINQLTLDSYCPISKQPDYKKCACRIEKA